MLQKFNWFGLRWGALIIIGSLLIDIEFLIVNMSFFLFHVNLGLKTIVKDYVHLEKMHLMLLIVVKIVYIELIGHLVELFI
uniref:Succinate:cytochrome c oxidoreductase subunit 4 n=1 Tax=Gelidium gabrielsonii TaxID=2483892 RepID=A0A3G2QX10_9FLOR|nr:succinate:cytochrome c oxidoreductase subunit 4 [Gelidium gabrielsonii]AYO27603.1 succinate:cytochrome c oxidoreductase subunit 4 [Gelidium gabrielsonii]